MSCCRLAIKKAVFLWHLKSIKKITQLIVKTILQGSYFIIIRIAQRWVVVNVSLNVSSVAWSVYQISGGWLSQIECAQITLLASSRLRIQKWTVLHPWVVSAGDFASCFQQTLCKHCISAIPRKVRLLPQWSFWTALFHCFFMQHRQ